MAIERPPQVPGSYLDRLHGSFGVGPSVVDDLVRRATGATASAIERVIRGYDNEVYRARVGTQTVFVRIKRFGEEPTFAGELWAMEAARGAGVPVPEILLMSQMSGFIADRIAERPQILTAGFTNGQFDHLIEVMETYAGEFPCLAPVLCHGDFTPDHVFVDSELNVSGVIDFGMYNGGPAVGDLALLAFSLTTDDLDAVLDGYANVDSRFRYAIDLHCVGLAVGHLAHHVSIGDTEGVDDLVRALSLIVSRT